ncbi:MAG: carboxylesterase/lipase family protein [Sphingomicrobium sp.]
MATAASVAGYSVVETRVGRVRGSIEQGLHVFRGIRYGNAKRFEAPRPVAASQTITDALAFGPSAPQRGSAYSPQSEDCLFLNVWSPEARSGPALPVMVYFHGGAYATGSVADPLNDGRHLAAKNAVVVTVNHRLNALGYLYLARLDARFPDSGNAGQLDLVLALQWIRDNIAAFGGDPRRVMVFGQSGGGAKIATLMGMPAATGLFHRAATMSGQQVTASGPMNATARARAFLARLKTTPAEVATIPVERIVEALDTVDPIIGGEIYFGPVLDMTWLRRHPFWPDSNPQSNAIPMILGNTRDETRGFFGRDHPKIVGLGWGNLAERMGPELRVDIDPSWVVQEYRRMFPAYTTEQIFFAATTAGRSWRGQVDEADARARANAPTWVYRLDFASPLQPWRGAPHTLDIPLVFGTLDAPGSLTGTGAAARAVSDAMMNHFLGLARNGRARWPMYRLPQRATMIFDTAARVENDPRGRERELFARVPYIQPGT